MIFNNTIYLGRGGNGGYGGDGGYGVSGGSGGAGGTINATLPYSVAGPGGNGGNGGDGGNGGGGGGGAGGWSIGIFTYNVNSPDYHSTNVIITSTGKGGLEGAPGRSLGYDGEYGEAGILNATHYGS